MAYLYGDHPIVIAMKYKCLIAEDDLIERDTLELLLSRIEQAEIVAVCEDGIEAVQVLMNQDIDIVLTDIDMPGLSGINLLKSIKHPPVFIFISAYKEYAADGFDLDIIDFIVKPVTQHRLIKAFAKATDFLNTKSAPAPETAPVIAADTETAFFARTDEGTLKIELRELIYIESKANFSTLFLRDGSNHNILVGLKKLEEQLTADFIRIHQKYLINWQHITLVQPASITLDGKHSLPLGPAYRKIVADKIAHYKMLERNPGHKH